MHHKTNIYIWSRPLFGIEGRLAAAELKPQWPVDFPLEFWRRGVAQQVRLLMQHQRVA